MNKKKIIIILSILIITIVIASLYGTFATNTTVDTTSSATYSVTLTDSTSEVTVPASSSKTIYYQLNNNNNGTVKYGVAYSGTNITVKVYSDSNDPETGLINYGENKFIKLYIQNTGTTDSTATITTILGYENGGSLDTILTSGYSWITDIYHEITPLSHFEYYLGSENSTVSTINYYDESLGITTPVSVEPMTLSSNEVLLVKYKGSSKEVVVPDTYVVNGVTYNVVMLSYTYVYYYDETTDYEIDDDTGIFEYNDKITSVILGDNIRLISNSAYSLFNHCSNLQYVPVIPSSVTSMWYTFYYCTSLVNAPVIPSNVTNMDSTFEGCTSLVNAPVIPFSVTSMGSTFRNCSNLTGTVQINSSNISSANYIFSGTNKSIVVNVPSGSTTYTTLNNLTTTNGKPSNVTVSTY